MVVKQKTPNFHMNYKVLTADGAYFILSFTVFVTSDLKAEEQGAKEAPFYFSLFSAVVLC
jgi:hypothetical protein